MGKGCKIAGYTMLGIGLAGTVGFGALLGVGANATYRMGDASTTRTIIEKVSSPAYPATPTIEAGIGSMNYGEFYVNGRMVDKEATINNLPISPDLKAMLIASMNNKESYKEFVNEAKKSKRDAEQELKKYKESNSSNPIELLVWERLLNLSNATIKAYDESLAGAILTSICILSVIISIPLIIVGKKKAKQA